MTVVVGLGAIGFAAVSKAGISFRPTQAQEAGADEKAIVTRYDVPGCRIEKTLKYDYNGNPYMKKVRVCA